jgi:hypothetical protein
MKTILSLIIVLIVTTCSAQKFYQYQRFTTNLDGTLINGNTLTNVSAAAPTIIASNFVSGVWYTNNSGRTENVSIGFTATVGAGAVGSVIVNLQVDTTGGHTLTTVATQGKTTVAGELGEFYYFTIRGDVPAAATYVFTNTVSGSGNSIGFTSSTGRLKQY